MKKWIIIISVALCFCTLSCKKEKNENSYCVNVIYNSPTITALSESEMEVVKYLFNLNQLDYTKYQFTRFEEDEFGHHIRCNQFVNNLIIFYGDLIFHFDKNDSYYSLSGDLVNTINLNTTFSTKQDYVVEKFIDLVKHDEMINYKDIIYECFEIEFGYYDLNDVTSTDPHFVKAWKITPANKEYPVAYLNDETSGVIYYFDGIMYFDK